jgi:hypothetical protein
VGGYLPRGYQDVSACTTQSIRHLLTPYFDFIVISARYQQCTTRMKVDTTNRSYTGVSIRVLRCGVRLDGNLRVLQNGLQARPCDSSTTAHFHCAERLQATAELGKTQDLITNSLVNHDLLNTRLQHTPLTRLLFDSNFVSIVDIVGGFCAVPGFKMWELSFMPVYERDQMA